MVLILLQEHVSLDSKISYVEKVSVTFNMSSKVGYNTSHVTSCFLSIHTAPSWAACTKPVFMAIHQCPENFHVPFYYHILIHALAQHGSVSKFIQVLLEQEQLKSSPRAGRLKWNPDRGLQIYSCLVKIRKKCFLILIEIKNPSHF